MLIIQCWGAGTLFSPALGSMKLPLKKAWLFAAGSRFYKFLLPAPVSHFSEKARLQGAVFRGFYWLRLPLNRFNGTGFCSGIGSPILVNILDQKSLPYIKYKMLRYFFIYCFI